MDIKYVGRVLARLQPFVRDRVIRRTRIDRVLGTLQTPPAELQSEIERLLAMAGIAIEEDLSTVADELEPIVELENKPNQDFSTTDLPPTTSGEQGSEAVATARQRMERDRRINNHARVLLKSDEEIGLAILVRGVSGRPLAKGDFARLTGEARVAAECLLLHNQGLVHSVAQRYAPSGMTYEDVFQHGMVGLIRAVELFDPTLGNKFSTYAMNWVRQSITRSIANESRLIRLPVHMFERVQKVWHNRTLLTVDGKEPSVHQLALACELNEAQVTECLMLGPHDILSLDAPVGPEGEMTLGDLYETADPDADPVHALEFALMREQLFSVLDTLSEREAGVISLRFGLSDDDPKTLDEIGKVYGVTRERIRQIEKQVMGLLQDSSRSMVLRPYMYDSDELPKHQPDTDMQEVALVQE